MEQEVFRQGSRTVLRFNEPCIMTKWARQHSHILRQGAERMKKERGNAHLFGIRFARQDRRPT
jgi:hypothetical protein